MREREKIIDTEKNSWVGIQRRDKSPIIREEGGMGMDIGGFMGLVSGRLEFLWDRFHFLQSRR